MKKLFILFFIYSIHSAQAQVTVNQHPEAGSWYTLQATAYDEIDFARQIRPTGGNLNWDFKGLTTGSVDDTVFYLNPKDFNLAQPVQGSNLLVIDYTNQLAPLGYYLVTNTDQKLLGLYQDTNITVKFDKAFLTNKFPLKENDEFEDMTTFNINLEGIGQARVELESFNLVDGWGEVTTESGKFPCLRIKSTSTLQGSVFGVPFFNSTNVDYRWISPGYDYDVFKYSVTEFEFGVDLSNDTLAYNLVEQNSVRVNDVKKEILKINLVPNPASDFVDIMLPEDYLGTYSIEILNENAAAVYNNSISGRQHKIDVKNWPRGSYMIKVSSDKNNWGLQKLILN